MLSIRCQDCSIYETGIAHTATCCGLTRVRTQSIVTGIKASTLLPRLGATFPYPSAGPHANASKRTLLPVSHAYVLSLLLVQNIQIHPRFDFPQWDLAVRSDTQPNLFFRVHNVVVNLHTYVHLLHRDPTVLQQEPETLEGVTILVVPLAFRDVEEMLDSLYYPPSGCVTCFILKSSTLTSSLPGVCQGCSLMSLMRPTRLRLLSAWPKPSTFRS
jgi:hypothetical protein